MIYEIFKNNIFKFFHGVSFKLILNKIFAIHGGEEMLLGLIFSSSLPCSSRAVPASQGKLWDKICIAGRLVAELS